MRMEMRVDTCVWTCVRHVPRHRWKALVEAVVTSPGTSILMPLKMPVPIGHAGTHCPYTSMRCFAKRHIVLRSGAPSNFDGHVCVSRQPECESFVVFGCMPTCECRRGYDAMPEAAAIGVSMAQRT